MRLGMALPAVKACVMHAFCQVFNDLLNRVASEHTDLSKPPLTCAQTEEALALPSRASNFLSISRFQPLRPLDEFEPFPDVCTDPGITVLAGTPESTLLACSALLLCFVHSTALYIALRHLCSSLADA